MIRWERHIATLDTAILSLIGDDDIPEDGVEAALDDILQSSLWQRRLLRRGEPDQAGPESRPSFALQVDMVPVLCGTTERLFSCWCRAANGPSSRCDCKGGQSCSW